MRKIFAEQLPELVAPWAQMMTRLCQAIQAIGLATCGRLGARLASRLEVDLTPRRFILQRRNALYRVFADLQFFACGGDI